MINGVPAGGAPPAKSAASCCGPDELSLDISRCEVLNASNPAALAAVLGGGGELRSDCDEQLLITIAFPSAVKLHSIVLEGPGSAPDEIRLFLNRTAMGFDDAEAEEPLQALPLDEARRSGAPLLLQYVKFQNVSTLTLFAPSNQEESEVTTLHRLRFHGSVHDTTNMKEFKRVG